MNKTLHNKLNRSLCPLGFIKNGETWRRNNSIAFDVVGIQLAQFSSGISVNVGVYFKNLGNDTNPIDDKCHLRHKLSGAIDGIDVTRYSVEFDDSEFQADQVVSVLIRDGLPWFDLVKTRKGAMAVMDENPELASSALLDAIKYGSIKLG